MLETRGLCAGYGDASVLREVSLTVDEGSLVVLTGPNGHGKTTLLRVLSRLIEPWSGEVFFEGRALDRASTADVVDAGLIHIPQGDLLFQDLTVGQNLLMGAYHKRAWASRASRLDRVYQLFPRLRERAAQQARTLSGGERRMVAIGRGLMSQARLLMIDEPGLGLAPVLVGEVYDSLREIAETEATVLIVDENVRHAQGIADKLYVMYKGEIAHGGESDSLEEFLTSAYLGL